MVADEFAFWRDDCSANPDLETYRACGPSLTRTSGMWIGISSPYRRGGLLFSKFEEHFDTDDDDVLVRARHNQQFNPTIDPAVIAREMAKTLKRLTGVDG